MADENDAVGIFDSGVGGLTVFRRVAEAMPKESIIYLGDTARVPYGTKSPDTVIRYARACSAILVARGIKLLVVACNTASAHALSALRETLDVPVIGVIGPGAQAAAERSATARIGVIGTAGTIASGAYKDAILLLRPEARVFSKPCPLFAPLAEEGWTNGAIPRAIAQTYLEGLLRENIDTLVLGCTHYPLLAEVIADVVQDSVTLVDSARETAAVVEATLDGMALRCTQTLLPQYRFMVSDAPDGLAQVGARFLGRSLGEIEWVDF